MSFESYRLAVILGLRCEVFKYKVVLHLSRLYSLAISSTGTITMGEWNVFTRVTGRRCDDKKFLRKQRKKALLLSGNRVF